MENTENLITLLKNRNYQNLKTIISIFDIPEDAVMLDKIRAVKRGEVAGPVSKNSDHLGLPGPAFETLMSLRHGKNYRHVSSNPNPHPILGADWNANSSSSSSSSSNTLGGRKTKRRK